MAKDHIIGDFDAAFHSEIEVSCDPFTIFWTGLTNPNDRSSTLSPSYYSVDPRRETVKLRPGA
jgi:hypothetical protein